MLVDSHTHLDDCGGDIAALVTEAREAGVAAIIQSGIDLESSRYSVRLAEQFPEVFATVGLHPLEAGHGANEQMPGIERLTEHPRVIGVGETGLDFHHESWPYEVQADVFLRHVDLARRAQLPLVIHTRDAEELTLALLDEHAAGLTVIFHCFNMPSRLPEAVGRSYYMSFAGNLTYESASDLQAAAREVPGHLLLLETDAPWYAPAPLRERRNCPALVAEVYDFVARLRGVTTDDLAAQVEANVRRAFPKLAGQLVGQVAERPARRGGDSP